MNPTMKGQLKNLAKQHPELVSKELESRQKPGSHHTERLSNWEWKELMGQFEQTLSRRNGALRRGR